MTSVPSPAAPPLRLEVVVPDGFQRRAFAYLLRHGRVVRTLALVAAVTAGLWVATGSVLWLAGLVGYVALASVLVLRWARHVRVALRSGSVVAVEWRHDNLEVRRSNGTYVFRYDGAFSLPGRGDVAGLAVRGSQGPATLLLPASLVTAAAIERLSSWTRPSGPTLDRTFVVPATGFPRRMLGAGISRGKLVLLTPLVVVECASVALLVVEGEGRALAGAAVILIAFGAVIARGLRLARVQLPPGSMTGSTLRDGLVTLLLPSVQVTVPDAQVRQVTPMGVDIVQLRLSRGGGRLYVPRALVPDSEIDRLRRQAGRRPMRASVRLPSPPAG